MCDGDWIPAQTLQYTLCVILDKFLLFTEGQDWISVPWDFFSILKLKNFFLNSEIFKILWWIPDMHYKMEVLLEPVTHSLWKATQLEGSRNLEHPTQPPCFLNKRVLGVTKLLAPANVTQWRARSSAQESCNHTMYYHLKSPCSWHKTDLCFKVHLHIDIERPTHSSVSKSDTFEPLTLAAPQPSNTVTLRVQSWAYKPMKIIVSLIGEKCAVESNCLPLSSDCMERPEAVSERRPRGSPLSFGAFTLYLQESRRKAWILKRQLCIKDWKACIVRTGMICFVVCPVFVGSALS